MLLRLLNGALIGVIAFIVAAIILTVIVKIGLLALNIAFWAAVIGLLVFAIAAITGWTVLTPRR